MDVANKKDASKSGAVSTTPAVQGKEEDKVKSVLELLEEDDEFEEFEGSAWENAASQQEDTQLWRDDWEDEDLNDDFTQQLRSQVEGRMTN